MSETRTGPISVADIKPLATTLKPIKLEGAEAAEFARNLQSVLEGAYTVPVGPTSYGDYAKVMVNGKAVATLGNDGCAQMSNALGAKLGNTLENNGSGPELAKRRADQIAKALGGTVVVQPGAMTQAAWNARPPIAFTVDYAAMARDGVLDTWKRAGATASTFSAQMIAQAGDA